MASHTVMAAVATTDAKEYCDKEMAGTTQKLDDLNGNTDLLSSKIDKKAALSAKLKGEVQELSAKLGQIARSQAEMDSVRSSENKAFTTKKSDLEQGLDGVHMALKVKKNSVSGLGDHHHHVRRTLARQLFQDASALAPASISTAKVENTQQPHVQEVTSQQEMTWTPYVVLNEAEVDSAQTITMQAELEPLSPQLSSEPGTPRFSDIAEGDADDASSDEDPQAYEERKNFCEKYVSSSGELNDEWYQIHNKERGEFVVLQENLALRAEDGCKHLDADYSQFYYMPTQVAASWTDFQGKAICRKATSPNAEKDLEASPTKKAKV